MPPTNFFSQKPKPKARMSSRQRPLHACGVTILAIVDNVFGKTQDINGPLGSSLKRVTKLARFFTPLIYFVQYQWLAILSFIDDRILAAEQIAEKLFPPSTYAFDKIDEIVLMIMSLPEKFDGAVNMFPAIIHQVPFVEWALTHAISRLNSLASTLNNWGQENSRMNEKTIGVDSSSNEEPESASGGYLSMDERMESFPPIPEAENKVVNDIAVLGQVNGSSYKEALERGKEEMSSNNLEKEWEGEKKIDEDECEVNEGIAKNDGNNEECGSVMQKGEGIKDNSLLDLFESAWLMKPGRY